MHGSKTKEFAFCKVVCQRTIQQHTTQNKLCDTMEYHEISWNTMHYNEIQYNRVLVIVIYDQRKHAKNHAMSKDHRCLIYNTRKSAYVGKGMSGLNIVESLREGPSYF